MNPTTKKPTSRLPMPSSVRKSKDIENKVPVVRPGERRSTVSAWTTSASLKRSRSSGDLNNKPALTIATQNNIRRLGNASNTANHRVPTHAASNAVAASTMRQPNLGDEPPPKKKRPAWDIKGRLLDMEQEFQESRSSNRRLIEQMEENSQKILQLELANQRLNTDVEVKTSQTQEASARISELEEAVRAEQASKRQAHREVEDMKLTMASLERQKASLQGELDALVQEKSSLKLALAELQGSQATLQSRLDASLAKTEMLEQALKDREVIIHQRDATILEMEDKLRKDEALRRKLHNAVQELKGNIRVFCRVRPLLDSEAAIEDMGHITFPEHGTIELAKSLEASVNESTMSVNSNAGGKKSAVVAASASNYHFQFDCVFSPKSTQHEVFEEISQLVQSVLDGYNVCIFAYGQTGSGKTFTMEGPSTLRYADGEDPAQGMIPRSVSQIFQAIEELAGKGWEYALDASFLEIYNETIRDLLAPTGSQAKYDIKMVPGRKDEVFVTNLTHITITSQNQVPGLLQKAHKNRAVAATSCNEHSSRSHSVFRLKLTGNNPLTGESCEATLNLIDLAGSERLKSSQAEGDRLRETKNINKSLSNLGNVILALAQKDGHVPYRNSKLTHLLMNSLGGNSKTLMFVNISPLEKHFGETLNSLRFATKVNQCQIGTATKQVR